MEFGFTVKQVVDEGRVTVEEIDLLRSWLSTQDLPKLTDEQITFFLLSCCNDQEATKATIKAHYEVRANSPETSDDRNVDREDLRRQLEVIDFCVFPDRTDDGCAIIFARLHDTYYGSIEPAPAVKLLDMTLDSVVYSYPPKGLIILFDMSGIGLMHLTVLKLKLMNTVFRYLQEGFPMRLKEIHVLNTVYFLDKVLAVIKPFIKKSVLDLVRFHQRNMDMELFYKKWLPKRCMPKDYGGDLPPVSVLRERNIAKLTEMKPVFEAEELQRRSIK